MHEMNLISACCVLHVGNPELYYPTDMCWPLIDTYCTSCDSNLNIKIPCLLTFHFLSLKTVL